MNNFTCRVDSVLDPWAFHLIVGGPHIVTMPDGSNVRKTVADIVHDVQKRILEVDEGDTLSIQNVVQVLVLAFFAACFVTFNFLDIRYSVI